MIVDRFKEVKGTIREVYKPKINKKDPLYPFFQLVQETTRLMWSFTNMIDEYKSRIVHFFSIVDEEQRIKELDEMMKHRRFVKERMHDIKDHLFKIERTFLLGKKKKPEATQLSKKKKKKKKVKSKKKTDESSNVTLPRLPTFREGEDMNNLYDVQYRFIVNSFLNKCEYFFQIEQDFKERKEAEVIRRMKIFTGDVGEEELKGVIMKGADFQQVQELYKNKTFMLRKNDKRNIRIELDCLKETKKELLDLEMQMNEIVDMFQDMFVLTNLLDEPINNLEYMVEQTNQYVMKARSHIKNARKMQLSPLNPMIHPPKCIVM